MGAAFDILLIPESLWLFFVIMFSGTDMKCLLKVSAISL